MSNIKNHAVLASLDISTWSARKFDAKASNQTAVTNEANVGSVRAHKRLLGNSPAPLQAVTNAAEKARREHRKLTLPWGKGEGCGILPATMYLDYVTTMNQCRSEFEHAVNLFLEDYEFLRDNARADLGKMYREADYPSPAKLRTKFDFGWRVYPLPDTNDFRLHILDNNELSTQFEDTLKSHEEDARKEVWERLYVVVKRMADRLAGDKRLREDGFSHISEVCDLLDKLNITGDSDLSDTICSVRQHLTDKPEPDQREAAEQKAQEILESMGSYMNWSVDDL